MKKILGLISIVFFIAGCSDTTSDNQQVNSEKADKTTLVIMDDQLEPLKRDFHTASDQLRLLFIVGPT